VSPEALDLFLRDGRSVVGVDFWNVDDTVADPQSNSASGSLATTSTTTRPSVDRIGYTTSLRV
jgi:hypothetical protein